MEKTAIIIFKNWKKNESYDVEIPLYITANELFVALNSAFALGKETDNISKNYLKAENPFALLRGNRTLSEYGIHNGTIINYTE